MKKTTVYLNEDDAEGLRRASAETGRSQSELIRDGIRRVIGRRPKRKFHSMGKGASGRGYDGGWDADELYEKVMGRRPR